MITFAKSFVGQLPVLINFYDLKLILNPQVENDFGSFGSGWGERLC